MKLNLSILLRSSRNARSDVLGIDVGTSATKIVRLKRTGERLALVAAELRPALQPPTANDLTFKSQPLVLDRVLKGVHAAFAISTKDAILKLLTVPGSAEKATELNFADMLGLPEGVDYRTSHRLLDREGRADTHVLATALPESQVKWLCSLLPTGLPVPAVVEVAGLAALTCYLNGPGVEHRDESVMVVDFGAETTTMGILYRGRPAVLRQFGVGSNGVVRQVRQGLGIDDETARGILDDGSVNARAAVHAVLEPFLRQASISRDFSERRFNSRVQRLAVTGGFTANADWCAEVQATLGLVPEPWSPWGMVEVAPEAVSESTARMELRFASAMGAALGALEEA